MVCANATVIRLAIAVLSKLTASFHLGAVTLVSVDHVLPVHRCVVGHIGEGVIGRDMQRGGSSARLI